MLAQKMVRCDMTTVGKAYVQAAPWMHMAYVALSWTFAQYSRNTSHYKASLLWSSFSLHFLLHSDNYMYRLPFMLQVVIT